VSRRISAAVMVANMHLLSGSLSFRSRPDGWEKNQLRGTASRTYGAAQLMPALAYYILRHACVRANGPGQGSWPDALAATSRASARTFFCLPGSDWRSCNPLLACAAYVLLALDVAHPPTAASRKLLKALRIARSERKTGQ